MSTAIPHQTVVGHHDWAILGSETCRKKSASEFALKNWSRCRRVAGLVWHWGHPQSPVVMIFWGKLPIPGGQGVDDGQSRTFLSPKLIGRSPMVWCVFCARHFPALRKEPATWCLATWVQVMVQCPAMVVSLAIDQDGSHPQHVVIVGCHWLLYVAILNPSSLSTLVTCG